MWIRVVLPCLSSIPSPGGAPEPPDRVGLGKWPFRIVWTRCDTFVHLRLLGRLRPLLTGQDSAAGIQKAANNDNNNTANTERVGLSSQANVISSKRQSFRRNDQSSPDTLSVTHTTPQ